MVRLKGDLLITYGAVTNLIVRDSRDSRDCAACRKII
jgi:hypothetical protein